MAVQPATAYSTSSPASDGGGVAQKFLGALLGGATGAAGIPGFSSSSSATSGDAYQGGSTTGAGFNVNFGGSQGGVPSWVWIAGAIAAVLVWKRSK